eukprot:Clim_evm46s152 gene=Clim_evmTU46s152
MAENAEIGANPEPEQVAVDPEPEQVTVDPEPEQVAVDPEPKGDDIEEARAGLESDDEDNEEPQPSVFTDAARRQAKKRQAEMEEIGDTEDYGDDADTGVEQVYQSWKKPGKRRRNADDEDLITDRDDEAKDFVRDMYNAVKEDEDETRAKRPALAKWRMLPQLKKIMGAEEMQRICVDEGILHAMRLWLELLPDKSLPSLDVRRTILEILQKVELSPPELKESGIGKAIMVLLKHPKETKANKRICKLLVRNWSQQIFRIKTEFNQLEQHERDEMENAMAGQVRARRQSQFGSRGDKLNFDANAGASKEEEDLDPNSKRARILPRAQLDYVIRPRQKILPEEELGVSPKKKGEGAIRSIKIAKSVGHQPTILKD